MRPVQNQNGHGPPFGPVAFWTCRRPKLAIQKAAGPKYRQNKNFIYLKINFINIQTYSRLCRIMGIDDQTAGSYKLLPIA
ncbi:hypothetical protein BpHYR1_041324, partial [Brachionus plicatilis]